MPESNQRIQQPYIEYTLSKTMDDVLNSVSKAMGLLYEFKDVRDKKNKELSVEEEKRDTKMNDSSSIYEQMNSNEEEKKEEVNNQTTGSQQSR